VKLARWFCHDCTFRFHDPDYSLVNVKLPLTGIISDDDPSLPRGQVIKYKCPHCGSSNLGGAANSDPFTPIKVKRN